MARKRTTPLGCPTCKNPVQHKNPDFPFCSERCRLIDLGKWASGGYVISTPVHDISDSIPDSPPKSSDED